MPFILGIVVGLIIFYSIDTFGLTLQEIVKWLAILSALLVFIATSAWFAYKVLVGSTSSSFKGFLAELEETPSKITDKDFREKKLFPLLPDMLKAGISWLSFSGAMAIALALITNITLLATLAVQQVQVQRLTEQNILLGKQNTLMDTQTTALEKQTIAAMIEQSQSLGVVLTDFKRQEEEIARIINALKGSKNTTVNNQFNNNKYEVTRYLVNNCSSTASSNNCVNASYEEVFSALLEHEGSTFPAHEFHDAFLSVALYLQQRNQHFYKATKVVSEVSEDSIRNETEYIKLALENSLSICDVEPKIVREVILRVSTMRLIESNAHFVGEFKFHNEFGSLVEKFSQIGDNTKRGFLNFRVGMSELIERRKGAQLKGIDFTLGQFANEISEELAEIEILLNSVSSACTEQKRKLELALSKLDV